MPRRRTWAGEMKRNDRIFAIEFRNRGCVRRGTATVWRWVAILEAIKRRHVGASISPKYTWRITVRSREAGPIVVTCKAIRRSSAAVSKPFAAAAKRGRTK